VLHFNRKPQALARTSFIRIEVRFDLDGKIQNRADPISGFYPFTSAFIAGM
jgi:hypothetical protein